MEFLDTSGSYSLTTTTLLCVPLSVSLSFDKLVVVLNRSSPSVITVLSFSVVICNDWELLISMPQVSEEATMEWLVKSDLIALQSVYTTT